MNDILVLVMNACALMTISYIAIKLRGRMGADRLLPVSLLTGLASIVMMALPHPVGFPMHDMRYAPVIMVSLRFGGAYGLLSTVPPILYALLFREADPLPGILHGLLIPSIISSFFHKGEYRSGYSRIKIWDGAAICSVLYLLRFGTTLYDPSSRGLAALAGNTVEWAVSIVMVFLLIAMLNEESSAWFDQRKLELMASQDRLTRLPNLRSFMRIAENTLNEQPIAILMLDIDDFKNYNDRLGHLQGDQLLQEAGAVLRSAAGEKDYVARYGGEEFIVMSSGCDDISMAVLAGKLCRTVSDYPFPKREVQPDGRITISVGAAAAKQPKEDLRRLIAQADEALYYSKHTGKSKYTIYEDTLPAVMKGHGSRIPGA